MSYHHNLVLTPVIVHRYLPHSHSFFFFCGLFYNAIRARLHSVEWYDDGWTINWKSFWSGHDLIEILSQYMPIRSDGSVRSLGQKSQCPGKDLNQHFQIWIWSVATTVSHLDTVISLPYRHQQKHRNVARGILSVVKLLASWQSNMTCEPPGRRKNFASKNFWCVLHYKCGEHQPTVPEVNAH
jgi:hypothetical protein